METRAAIVIRDADLGDAPALAQLRFQWRAIERDERGSDAPEFAAAFARWMATHRDSHQPFLALRGTEPIGMAWLATVHRVPGVAELVRTSGDVQSVYVVPGERGHGVATSLMQRLLDRARSEGLALLTLHHSPLSEPMYRRLGFTGPVRRLEIRLDA